MTASSDIDPAPCPRTDPPGGRLAPLARDALRTLRTTEGPVELLWTVAAANHPVDPGLLAWLIGRAGGHGRRTGADHRGRRRWWWVGVRAAAALAAIGLSAARQNTTSTDKAHGGR